MWFCRRSFSRGFACSGLLSILPLLAGEDAKNDVRICRLLSSVMTAENVDDDAIGDVGGISGMVGGSVVESFERVGEERANEIASSCEQGGV